MPLEIIACGADWLTDMRSAQGQQLGLIVADVVGHGDFILEPNVPYDWRNPKNDNLWHGVSGTNNPCPTGFRLPTERENQRLNDILGLVITLQVRLRHL